jgi:hypothetical protein
MSMLTFYINRAGRKMPAGHKRKLEAAKGELRRLYGRDGASRSTAKKRTAKKQRRKSTRESTRRRAA